MVRSGQRGSRSWWVGLAVGGYLALIGFPLLTAVLFLWVSSGANVVAEPVKAHAVGVVRDCTTGGVLYLRDWYSCQVHLTSRSALPPEVQVEPPDLSPTDLGRTVEVEQRSFRGSVEYTVARQRPFAVGGFVGCLALVLVGFVGFTVVQKRAGGSD